MSDFKPSDVAFACRSDWIDTEPIAYSGEDMSHAEVDFYEDAQGQWRWRVKALNGEILSQSSEAYVRRTDAERGFDLTAEALVREQDKPTDE